MSRRIEERTAYKSYELHMGFELDPLARNGAGDSEDCSCTGAYKTGGRSASSHGRAGFECRPSSSAPGWRVLPNEPRLS